MKKENETSEKQAQCAIQNVSTSTVYEYGAMSSKFKLLAKNKLTAYATMMVIYTPEECKEDSWTNITGKITERLDEVFGGIGSFDKYLEEHPDEIRECYKSIERVV